VNTSDYKYILPPEKIAIYPLPQRDASKLLVYRDGKISHSSFSSLSEHLPENTFLFFNDTKVIPARLHFRKESGANIEIFLLSPILPSPLLAQTMASESHCTWSCAIGNLKKWPSGMALQKKIGANTLVANIVDRNNGSIEFSWAGGESFAEIIHKAGETPLPPYIKRKAEDSDSERYQTIYSHHDGAVAAPTAGLHFTPQVFASLKEKSVDHDFVTLHVSAGTFQPIKTENPDEHVMHEEQLVVSRANVGNLLAPGRIIIAVGTTSMRTLESLYWFGVKLLTHKEAEFRISQRDPYIQSDAPSSEQALKAVADYMDKNGLDYLLGETSIFIRPGYRFKVCKGLITNFHQPGSTLILLVAAFAGQDWKKIYDEALNNNYRFLSYGDSSLILPGH
jgi:S-adenosylmethionine:tRNA ribosyltransferase-isomerase